MASLWFVDSELLFDTKNKPDNFEQYSLLIFISSFLLIDVNSELTIQLGKVLLRLSFCLKIFFTLFTLIIINHRFILVDDDFKEIRLVDVSLLRKGTSNTLL